MQLMDRVAGTSFFMPSGLVVNGAPLHISGGGSPLLWQHLFWFLGHPEVYVLILPGMGIVAEIIANNTRKPLWGYKSLVFAALVLGFLSFIVWAHHMWLTGMGTAVSAFFQTTTMIISIPSVIILSAFFISLWGGSIRFNVPMLFATAFLPMFGIGGLTGIPLAFNSADLYLHDTYYVIAHFHYIVAPGTIFALFAGIYYWFPKATGRMMNEFWGKVHFWPSLICMNVIFLPMFLQGMLGMHRRWYDGGQGWNAVRRKGLGLERFRMEHADLDCRLGHGPGANSVHHQFLLEHEAREEGERQSLGCDHPGMDGAFAAAARQFRHDADRLSRPVRIQPAAARDGFIRCKANRSQRRATAKPTTAAAAVH